MLRPEDRPYLERAFQDLGASPRDISAIEKMPWPQSRGALVALKARVRKNFHRLALQYHPDTNGGDPVKTAYFRLLLLVRSDLESIDFKPRPLTPRPVPMHPIGVNPFPRSYTGGFPPSGSAVYVTTTTRAQGTIRTVLTRI